MYARCCNTGMVYGAPGAQDIVGVWEGSSTTRTARHAMLVTLEKQTVGVG